MDKKTIVKLTVSFNAVAQRIQDENTEFWYARDLQVLLGYTDWRNFLKVIEKSRESARNAGAAVQNHFVDVNKMVSIGSGAERPIEDVMLTRYACYLIAQNSRIINLPDGWKNKRLDKVAIIQTGIAKNQNSRQETVELSYLRVANVQDGFLDLSEIKTINVHKDKVDRYRLKNGDVLLTEGGDFDKLGRGAVWEDQIPNCVHQNHVFVVRVNNSELLPSFLSAQTGSSYGKRYFLNCSKQSTNLASINSSQLKAFPVLFPPLPEQKAIVDLLSAWDEAIEKTERLIVEKQKFYEAQLSKHLSLGVTERIKLKKFLKEVSKRNKDLSITQILSVTNSNGFVRRENQFGKQVASNNLSYYKIVSKGEYAYNPSRINVGSIARLDSWDLGVLSPMYAVFEIEKPSELHTDLFLHWLNSREAKQRIKQSAQGSVRETVSFDDFCAIGFPRIDLEEQEAFAEYFSSILEEIDVLKALSKKYKTQKRGLMQKVLSGQWRVKEFYKEEL